MTPETIREDVVNIEDGEVLEPEIDNNRGYTLADGANSSNTDDTVYLDGSESILSEQTEQADENYTVWYYVNGGTFDAFGEKECKTYVGNGTLKGKTITIGKDISNILRDGYTFLGWAADKSATTAQYQNGDIYDKNDTINLYAVWEKTNSTIIASGKCGAEGDGSNLKWSLTSDGTLAIRGSGAMKEGYYGYKRYDSTYITTVPWGAYKDILKKLIMEDGITCISSYAFYGCERITGNCIIPNSVTVINDWAFTGCRFTGNLTIPSSVTTIGEAVFSMCRSFTGSLVIPDSVTSMGDGAFYNCSGFKGKLTLPNRITIIGEQTFGECTGFTGNLIIPDSVTTIGSSAFAACIGFTGDLVIPNSVTTIGKHAFYNCSGFMGNLVISNSAKTIGNWAFAKCKRFTGNLVIPNSVETIGTGAFSECSGFKGKLTLSNRITIIAGETFAGCSGFTGNLVIPKGVTSIGDYAFSDCSGFTGDLVIPEGVTSIGDYAFGGCGKIERICFRGDAPKIEKNSFSAEKTLYYIKDKSGWTSPTWNGYNTATWSGNEDRIPGDINDDGKVDIRDAIRLAKYLAKENVEINLSNANINGDDKVDVRDLIRLKKYLAKMPVDLI